MNKATTILIVIITWFTLSLLCAFPAKWLWNYLMPMIFNLPKLTFWQTFGLQMLCWLFIPRDSTNSSYNNRW